MRLRLVSAATFVAIAGPGLRRGQPARPQVAARRLYAGACCQTGWYSSPAVADLDGDGQAEVIWGSYDLVVLQGSSGTLRARATNGQRVWPGVAVADLTGDGTLEIVGGPQRQPGPRLPVRRPGDPVRSCGARLRHFRSAARCARWPWTTSRPTASSRSSSGAGAAATSSRSTSSTASGAVRPGWPARHDGEPGLRLGHVQRERRRGRHERRRLQGDLRPHRHPLHHRPRPQRQPARGERRSTAPPRKVWSQVGVHVDQAVDLARLRQLRHRAPARTSRTAPRSSPTWTATARRSWWWSATSTTAASAIPYGDLYHMPFILKLDRTRWAGSGFDWTAIPDRRSPGSGPLSRGLQRDREQRARHGGGRPRRRRPEGDPLPLLRRPRARLLARQDRARQLALPRAVDRRGGDTFRFARRAGGGRPRQRRPGRGDLHLVAQEGRATAWASSTSSTT